MAVRNFWLVADIDGRQTELAGGPRRKDGGMRIVVYQRQNGAVVKAVEITCLTSTDGVLKMLVDVAGQGTKAVITER